MRVAQLKKEVIRRTIATLIIVVICAVGYWYFQSYGDQLAAQRDQLQRDIVSLNSKIVNFERKQQEYEEAKQLWSTLSDSQKKRSGIILGNAQQLLDNLKDQYSLGGFKADISKPVELKDIYKTDTTVVMSTKVELTFDALTDESIFAFVAALSRGLPGYVKIDYLHVMRSGEINPLLIRNLQQGTYQPVVQAKMTFYWRDLKDITPEETTPPIGVKG